VRFSIRESCANHETKRRAREGERSVMNMKLLSVCCAVGVVLSVQGASAQTRSVYGIIGVDPASFLASPDVDGFSVSRSYGRYRSSQTVQGVGSWAPMLKGGLQFGSESTELTVTIGGGGLVNGVFTAGMAELALDLRFRLGRRVTLAPHLAAISISEPSWSGSADVSFSGTSGGAIGFDFTVGGRRVAFDGCLSYVALSPIDVETGSGWTANSDELDLSGVLLRCGVLVRL
jgi:hypothetical protein